MSTATDPQFTRYDLLRPFTTFQTVYAAQPANTPIMFTVGGLASDPLAGQGVAISSLLLRGYPTPRGSRVLLQVPKFTWTEAGNTHNYRWQFVWRTRSLADFNLYKSRLPYSNPKDTFPTPAHVIYAADQVVTYAEATPAGYPAATERTRVTGQVRTEDLVYGSTDLPLPLLPTGASGVFQQGLTVGTPFRQVKDLTAFGDELCVGIWRPVDRVASWTFGTTDAALVAALANLDEGVLIATGSAP